MAIAVTKETFNSQVLESQKPVLVDFWASWCGPCRMIAPVLDELSKEREDVKIVKINVDEEPELASRFGVMSIPTLLVFENGKVKSKAVGAIPKEQIEKLF